MYSFFNLAAPRSHVASGPYFILVGPVGEMMYSFFNLAAPRSLVASGPNFILVGPVGEMMYSFSPREDDCHRSLGITFSLITTEISGMP